ncbi:glycosyltransferase family 4 protein [Bacillus subtilis]|uniref:glycosyltransferase family 4 protein n=1 Tax=Bacillus subtilis TaxID=1423 RepID=UPI0021B13E04|nr:glycosyltransferase family 4 protein [Bacillus subtilis]MCT6511710.1 glycosyltransferase family 4 protein [Bacillus subtilis]MCX4078545.1 glycosyltransferase family 4 protein [Bacillus subtilis]MEC0398358.1 glycosyltransferase family 4 protein [Bacillus subtilis]MEC0433815.1 glycosyltransferase family 4 protein [Bacillus subtilis]WRU05377.1 glycosyltransferase family 4 protein [Bacillus subtilis]
MSKKILIITQNFYPELGSAGNRLKNIYLLLKQRGYDIQVLTTEPTYPSREIYKEKLFWNEDVINKDPSVMRVSVKNKKYNSSFLSRLLYYLEIMIKMLKEIRKEPKKFDIIFVSSPPIFVAFVGLVAKFKNKSKLILDIRDLWPESLKGVKVFHHPIIVESFRILEKLLYKKADHIVINSEGFLHYLNEHSPLVKEKVTFIPNSAREKELLISSNDAKTALKIIYVGNIGLAQNIHIIRNLAEKLHEHQIEFLIVGYGVEKKELLNYIREKNLMNVKIVNPMTRKECLELMSGCDIGIVTLKDSTVFETVLPGRIIDYITCGIPIVGSIAGYSKTIIEQEGVGLVTSNSSSEEMLANIMKIYNDPGLLKKMQKNCHKLIRENFMWETNIEKLINVIEDTR